MVTVELWRINLAGFWWSTFSCVSLIYSRQIYLADTNQIKPKKLLMKSAKKKIEIFKPYLKPSNLYVGGKSRKDLATNGRKIYKLSSNENPIGASPKALQAIRNHINGLHEYPDNTSRRLHEALEIFYHQEIDANQFITGNSGSEVLEMIIRAFLDVDLEYITSSPMFSPYRMFSDKMGAKEVAIPLLAPNFELDVEGILNAITDKTRLIFLTSPNNPTGTYISKATLDKLIYSLPDHVITVLDEVYYLFTDAEDYTTAQEYVAEGKNVIGLNSFSKSFGLAGLRMGYAYSTPELAEYIQRLYRPFLHNTLSLEACIAALSDHKFLEEGNEFD